jgi:hypothetical protein
MYSCRGAVINILFEEIVGSMKHDSACKLNKWYLITFSSIGLLDKRQH